MFNEYNRLGGFCGVLEWCMVGSTPLRLIRVFLFLKTEIIFLNKKHPSGVLWVIKGN